MTELKWKSFSDEWPNCPWTWVTDQKEVWLTHRVNLTIKEPRKDLLWAEAHIEYPPVPEKKRHSCALQYGVWGFKCYEDVDGALWLETPNNRPIEIEVCPWCGFTKEKG